MDTSITVNKADSADAGIISRILIRSITLGCALDHRNDPLIVNAWIFNKTIDHILPWIADPDAYLCLARCGDKPVGVGMARIDGRITLCYVQPEWFRRGAGQALVRDLEVWLAGQGCSQVRLNSTRTGLDFYTRLGYRQGARTFGAAGLIATPMYRPLRESLAQV